MIDVVHIAEWRAYYPWPQDSLVEQDLVISRALVDMFRIPELASAVAFRGGTALYKLFFKPAARYSEDIDLVQIQGEPIGQTIDLMRGALDPWLGKPRFVKKHGRVNLVYRFLSENEPQEQMSLKIEINTREHFSELGFTKEPFSVQSGWFSGDAEITTFELDELLGTKMRALYQRKKGRDLFDLWYALDCYKVRPTSSLQCFYRYMEEEQRPVSRAQFEENLHHKRQMAEFRNDISPLLRQGIEWNFDRAMDMVLAELIAKLPGDPWQGNQKDKA